MACGFRRTRASAVASDVKDLATQASKATEEIGQAATNEGSDSELRQPFGDRAVEHDSHCHCGGESWNGDGRNFPQKDPRRGVAQLVRCIGKRGGEFIVVPDIGRIFSTPDRNKIFALPDHPSRSLAPQ